MSAPCLIVAIQVSAADGQYILNGSSYVSRYGMGTGVYAFDNVPSAHPMAILSTSGISYVGDPAKKLTKVVDGVSRDFYHGNVKVTVSSDFGLASLYCYYHGYMGGQDMLAYQGSCDLTSYSDRLFSNNSRYRIVCQNDGNFVVYENSTGAVRYASSVKDRLWSPNATVNLQIQDDGNFVVYDTSSGANVPVFSTNSITSTGQKSPGNSYRFSVQDDGNIVLYDIRNGGSTPILSFNQLFADVAAIETTIEPVGGLVSNVAALQTAVQPIGGMSTDITALQTAVQPIGGMSTDITNLQNAIQPLDGLSASVSSNAGDITALQTAVQPISGMSAAITNLQTAVQPVSGMTTDITALQALVGTTSTQLAKNVADSTNIYNKLYNACSTIKFRVSGSSSVYTGSGTFISLNDNDKQYGLYMTAAHCVMEISGDPPTGVALLDAFFIRNPLTDEVTKFDSNIANILGYDGVADVAIIKTGFDLSGTNIPLSFASTPINIGDICYLCGNPGGYDDRSFAQGHVRDNNYTDTNGYQMVPSLYITTPGIGGNSGSAITNIDGDIVGIFTFGHTAHETFGGGANLQTINSIVSDLVTKSLNNSATDFRNSTTKNYLALDMIIPSEFMADTYYSGSTFARQGMLVYSAPPDGHPFDALIQWDLLLSYTHDGVEYPVGHLIGQYSYGLAVYLDASKPITLKYIRGTTLTTTTVSDWHVDYPELSDNPLSAGVIGQAKPDNEPYLTNFR